MRALIGVIAACAGLAAVTPAAADGGREAPEFRGSEPILQDLVQERDVTLLFDYLRRSLSAVMRGREAPPVPEELAGRAEALGQALRAQSAHAALALLTELEKRAKETLRERPPPRQALPPVQPSIRL